MSLEKDVARIADAMEVIVAAIQSPTPHPINLQQPPADTPDPTPGKGAKGKGKGKAKGAAKKKSPAAAEVTEEELRQVFQEFVARKGSEEGTAKLKELISGYGCAKIGDIDPEHYAEIVEEVRSWK